MDKESFNYNAWIFFIVFCFIEIGFSLLNKYLFINENFYEQLLGDQLDYERIQEIIADQDRWGWLIYIIIPISYLVKFSAVTSCLSLGFFLTNTPFKLTQIFKVVMLSEVILFFAAIIRMFYFLFIHPDFTPLELQYFYPLSLVQFADISSIASYWLYPLQSINFFELAYMFIIAYGLFRSDLVTSYSKSLNLTLASYGPGLLLWIITVLFIQTI